MSGNLSNLTALLKQIYPKGKFEADWYKDFPFLALLKQKPGQFQSGDNYKVPVGYSWAANQSYDDTVAFARTNAAKAAAFQVTHGNYYGRAYIKRQNILASKDKMGAVIDNLKFEVDGQINAVMHSISHDLFRSGSGSIGRISSGQTTDTVTLTNATDTRYFNPGDVVRTSTADGTGSLKTGTVTVESVNRSAGTVTITAATWDDAAGIPTVAANDYIFPQGNHSVPTTGTDPVKGLLAWLPTTAPSSGESFFSVDRSADPDRLAGVRATVSSGALREGFMDAANSLFVIGSGRPDYCFVHPNTFTNLAKEVESSVERTPVKDGRFSFNTLAMATPAGDVKFIADPYCPVSQAFMLTMDTWELASLGKVPHIADDDGAVSRVSGSDNYEVRVVSYPQLVCRHPSKNCVITIS